MSLFGSILRDELTPASDLDFLVRFEEGHAPGFLGLARMQRELSGLLGGREADLRTAEDLSPYFRDEVLSEAVPLYAAE